MGLKKILRKVGKGVKKAAPIALLALSAAALAKRRKKNALNAITDYGDTGPLSGKAGYEGDVPSAPKVNIVLEKKPEETYLQKGKDVGTAIPKIYASGSEFLAKGGRVGVGKAKRGFGRALRKK